MQNSAKNVWDLLGTWLKLVTSVIQQVPIVQAMHFLIELTFAIVYKHG